MADRWFIRVVDGIVTHGFSDDFEAPLEGDICINEMGGRLFSLGLRDMQGRALYKWSEGTLVARNAEELADDLIPKYASQQPAFERLGAPAYTGHDAAVQVRLRWGETLLDGKYRYTELDKSVKLPTDILPGLPAVDEYLATIAETLLAGAQAVHTQLASMEGE